MGAQNRIDSLGGESRSREDFQKIALHQIPAWIVARFVIADAGIDDDALAL
jgi:hypothetical protein